MIDRQRFASCIVPRTKTGKPQRLDIPDVLQVPLRAWWASQDQPRSGPVFPVTRGPRKGEAQLERGVSFADRLRRTLMLAGIKRHPCKQPDLHPTMKPPYYPELASDPVYNETGWSLPVDFHSFRRAFSTGLAEAGVNAQQATAPPDDAHLHDTRAPLHGQTIRRAASHRSRGRAPARAQGGAQPRWGLGPLAAPS
jgi:integrase